MNKRVKVKFIVGLTIIASVFSFSGCKSEVPSKEESNSIVSDNSSEIIQEDEKVEVSENEEVGEAPATEVEPEESNVEEIENSESTEAAVIPAIDYENIEGLTCSDGSEEFISTERAEEIREESSLNELVSGHKEKNILTVEESDFSNNPDLKLVIQSYFQKIHYAYLTAESTNDPLYTLIDSFVTRKADGTRADLAMMNYMTSEDVVVFEQDGTAVALYKLCPTFVDIEGTDDNIYVPCYYIGDWKDGKRNGYGIFLTSIVPTADFHAFVVTACNWENDVPVGEFAEIYGFYDASFGHVSTKSLATGKFDENGLLHGECNMIYMTGNWSYGEISFMDMLSFDDVVLSDTDQNFINSLVNIPITFEHGIATTVVGTDENGNMINAVYQPPISKNSYFITLEEKTYGCPGFAQENLVWYLLDKYLMWLY